MIYIIKGEETHLIREKLKELSSNEEATVVKIDGAMPDFTVGKMLNACRQIDLFHSFSIVLVKDAPFLISKYDKKDIDDLLEYVHNPIYECDLIFYTFENKYNEKLKLFKDIASNANVLRMEHLKGQDFYNFGKKAIKEAGLKLDYECSSYLFNNSMGDMDLLNRNIEILKLYPEELDIYALKSLITIKDEEDIFKLINAITSRNLNSSMIHIEKMLKQGESPIGIIALLSAQLRFLYTVGYYHSAGYKESDIMDIVGTRSSFRLKKAYEALENFNLREIMQLLDKLCDLDYRFKVDSQIDEKLKLELFLMELL
ncbi:MAG: DNA polymerase III subunit delta [Erysipelotrichaceae bacterium]|nr:DNA polymerase III subunit delta [Erysipelotrichaceae bacterium]